MPVTIDGTNGITSPGVDSTNLVLDGSTSGSITLLAPAVAGTNTQTLVAATGTLAPFISGTAVASTSGTSIDFTGIPSWVKRITVMLSGVSWATAQRPRLQIGVGGSVTTSGYVGHGAAFSGAGTAVTALSAGFDIGDSGATSAGVHNGRVVFELLDESTNTWVATGQVSQQATRQMFCSGALSLSGVLNIIRVTSVAGGTFNAGTINILYE